MQKNMRILLVTCLLLAGCLGAPSPQPTPTATPPAPPATAALPADTSQPPAAAPTPPPATNSPGSGSLPAPQIFPTGWSDRSVFRANLISSDQGVLNQLPGASVYHIDLTIPTDMVSLQGKEEVYYTNRTGKPLQEIYFRLFPNLYGSSLMTVSHLQVNGQSTEGVLEQENTALRVPVSPLLQPGQAAVISLDFSVNVPTDGGGNYNSFVYTKQVLALAQFYPLIPAYDSAGWHLEIPPNYGDVTYTDTSFYEIRVTAPETVTVASSGSILQQQKSGNQQVLTLAGGPIRDFYLAASDQYSVISEKIGETTVNGYASAGQKELAGRTLGFAQKAFASYAQHFGVYPYTVFNIIGTPNDALGIEYPQAIALNQNLWDPKADFGSIPASVLLEATTAHEIAHQWFYGVVGDDQVNQPWLDEAMAQYDTFLYYEDTYGISAAQSYSQDWSNRWKRVNDANTPIGLPVSSYTAQSYGAIVYGRGPIFIETLSQQMGADKFAAFLKDYYQTYQWGISTTDDFEKLANKDCGCNLDGLFNEWVK